MVFICKNIITFTSINITFAYNAVALLLNLLLTLMIIARVVLHMRNFKSAVGVSTGERLYTVIVTMLVESCALYTVAHLLYLIPLAAHSYISNVFPTAFALAQVRTTLVFPWRIAVSRRRLTMVMCRLSVHTLSFFESQTGGH